MSSTGRRLSYTNLDLLDQTRIRTGYYKLNNTYLDDKTAAKLSDTDCRVYFHYGVSVHAAEKKKQLIINIASFAGLALLCVGFLIFIGHDSNKSNTHYNSIAPVDVCASAIKTINLFSTDIYLDNIIPINPVTKYDTNFSSSCNFFIKGNGDLGVYTLFFDAKVEKTATKMKDDTKKDATLIESTLYPVFKYTGTKDYYSVSVMGGIDPAQSTLDPKMNELVSKLIILIGGAGIADNLQTNTNTQDL